MWNQWDYQWELFEPTVFAKFLAQYLKNFVLIKNVTKYGFLAFFSSLRGNADIRTANTIFVCSEIGLLYIRFSNSRGAIRRPVSSHRWFFNEKWFGLCFLSVLFKICLQCFHPNYMQVFYIKKIEFNTGLIFVQMSFKWINFMFFWVKRMDFPLPRSCFQKSNFVVNKFSDCNCALCFFK